ncbi:MAG TPA: hypothetical protein VML50_06855 [Anaeromyxobacter sp.]|nr:hypothetical protein [Anaeromyxobacter sp.]
MRSVLRLLALLLASSLALACAGPSASAAAPTSGGAAAFFPLAVGNQWIYVDESPALPPAQRGTRRTVRILERGADGYFRDNERGELRADADCVHDRLRRLLCGPITRGNSWSSVVSVGSTERYEIAGVGETVETPAGRFQGCVRVRAHNRVNAGTDTVLEISYAPGVGPVRIETWAVVEDKAAPQVRAVLQSYRIEGR